MATYSLHATQKIPIGIEKAWDFFSNPGNLPSITPAELGFVVISKQHCDKIYPGQLIEYKLRPFMHIPVYWMTEITHVRNRSFFVDEQRFGPYAFWHHQHHFAEVDGGVEMTDIVHYRIPLWILGGLANTIFVRRQLKKIFAYRFDKVELLFGKWNP